MKSYPSPNAKLKRSNLEHLPLELSHRIKGQPEILGRLAFAVIRRETESIPPRGPRERFFFAGPTGTGKTYTALCLTEFIFGRGHFHRFDCSEFKTLESVQSLLADQDGNAGRFSLAYQQVPVGVWLFDEFEKAHRDFSEFFLQMAGDGRLTLASGRTLDLSGIYLIVTSNLGSAEILGRKHLPFASMERHVINQIQGHLRPELLARFGRPYVFRPLPPSAKTEIVELELNVFVDWHKTRNRLIVPESDVVPFLVQRGFSERLGARPLLDAIYEHVGNAIAAQRLKGRTGTGRLVVRGDHLEIIP